MAEWMEQFGNPSSVHSFGRAAAGALENAREQLRAATGLRSYRVVFTSGGTEANHLALHRFARLPPEGNRRRILLSAIEHPCVGKQAAWFRAAGFQVELIPVDSGGVIDLQWTLARLDTTVAAVAVMLANNETGVIQPVEEIARACAEINAHLHCDAVQAIGKMNVQWEELGADSISLSAHKFHGPRGVGALFYRSKPLAIFVGGAQETGIRAGTENVAGALAMTEALRLALEEAPETLPHQRLLRNRLEATLRTDISGLSVAGRGSPRLVNTSCLVLPEIDSDEAVMRLDRLGFAVSSGAACHAGVWEPSAVLLAMGLDHDRARRAIRVSIGRDTTTAQIDAFAEKLVSLCKLARNPATPLKPATTGAGH